MKLKQIVASSCLALCITAGAAQDAFSYYLPNQPNTKKGIYIYAGLGAGKIDDSNVKIDAFNSSGTESFDLGAMVTTGVGYKFGNGFRAEFEYANRNNDVSKHPSFITVEGNGTPVYESQSVMANLLYEFRQNKTYSPYVGFGLGYTFLKNLKDADDQYAYQGIAGTIIKITEDIDIGIAYKYFSTFDTPLMSVKAKPSPVDTEYPYTAHSLEVRGILNF
jgi:opacity protein-like surface antigen